MSEPYLMDYIHFMKYFKQIIPIFGHRLIQLHLYPWLEEYAIDNGILIIPFDGNIRECSIVLEHYIGRLGRVETIESFPTFDGGGIQHSGKIRMHLIISRRLKNRIDYQIEPPPPDPINLL